MRGAVAQVSRAGGWINFSSGKMSGKTYTNLWPRSWEARNTVHPDDERGRTPRGLRRTGTAGARCRWLRFGMTGRTIRNPRLGVHMHACGAGL